MEFGGLSQTIYSLGRGELIVPLRYILPSCPAGVIRGIVRGLLEGG